MVIDHKEFCYSTMPQSLLCPSIFYA